MNQGQYDFPGWEPPLENWSKLPHAFIMLMPKMKLAEMRVTLYILRHTWGFGNYSESLSMTLDEIQNGRRLKGGGRMDNGTGLSKQSVINGIRAAVKRGTIKEEREDKDLARIKKSYKLRSLEFRQQGSKNWTAGVKNLDTDLNKEIHKDNSSPKAKRKPTKRDKFNEEMESAFSGITGIPIPSRKTAREKRAAGVRWNTPLWHIYDMVAPDADDNNRVYDDAALDSTLDLIRESVEHMRQEKLTISSPQSIEQVATSIYANDYSTYKVGSDDFWKRHME